MATDTGRVGSNPQNTVHGNHVHMRSKFPMSYGLKNTHRFGEYTPTFWMEGVAKDEISLRAKDKIDSYTLKAPLMDGIRKHKDLFMVPKEALLPLNWEQIYTNPTIGDDVPRDANNTLLNFAKMFALFNERSHQSVATIVSGGTVDEILTAVTRILVVGEYVYSAGSLMNVMGMKYSRCWNKTVVHPVDNQIRTYSHDGFFDAVIRYIFSGISDFSVRIPLDGAVGSKIETRWYYGLGTHSVDADSNVLNNRQPFSAFLELMRENPTCSLITFNYDSTTTAEAKLTDLQNLATNFFAGTPTIVLPAENTETESGDEYDAYAQRNLNIDFLLAYQMCVAHYYSNDHVDFIYSADLFRQYIWAFEKMFLASVDVDQNGGNIPVLKTHFTYNGMTTPYDYLSAHLLQMMYLDTGFNFAAGNVPTDSASPAATALAQMYILKFPTTTQSAYVYASFARFSMLSAIFGFRRSLRYLDYFTGVKVQPLAVGDVNVQVAANNVSVIDVTRNIQMQKFLNAVNRTGRKFGQYIQGLFGERPAPDYHNPFFVSATQEYAFAPEVQNTGEAQVSDAQSRTANFANNSGNYEFHMSCDRPCLFIQLVSYDIERSYVSTVERHALQVDRFDMFNPDMQYIGDQPVLGVELGVVSPTNALQMNGVFGYQTRDMEYKQRFHQAAGGFVENLPGWAIISDVARRQYEAFIGPDFIRSSCSELDAFYLALSGFSLGSYFHFIVETTNDVEAVRNMAYAPNIL
nr:MAG: major capsid protein [Microviridae sp.]